MSETLGHRVKVIREAVQISQRALAIKSGVAARTIAYIEDERGYPRVDTLGKILRALGVPEARWGEFMAADQGVKGGAQ